MLSEPISGGAVCAPRFTAVRGVVCRKTSDPAINTSSDYCVRITPLCCTPWLGHGRFKGLLVRASKLIRQRPPRLSVAAKLSTSYADTNHAATQ
jgi:hypothetical protein